jgi:hypothetical protein
MKLTPLERKLQKSFLICRRIYVTPVMAAKRAQVSENYA